MPPNNGCNGGRSDYAFDWLVQARRRGLVSRRVRRGSIMRCVPRGALHAVSHVRVQRGAAGIATEESYPYSGFQSAYVRPRRCRAQACCNIAQRSLVGGQGQRFQASPFFGACTLYACEARVVCQVCE